MHSLLQAIPHRPEFGEPPLTTDPRLLRPNPMLHPLKLWAFTPQGKINLTSVIKVNFRISCIIISFEVESNKLSILTIYLTKENHAETGL